MLDLPSIDPSIPGRTERALARPGYESLVAVAAGALTVEIREFGVDSAARPDWAAREVRKRLWHPALAIAPGEAVAGPAWLNSEDDARLVGTDVFDALVGLSRAGRGGSGRRVERCRYPLIEVTADGRLPTA